MCKLKRAIFHFMVWVSPSNPTQRTMFSSLEHSLLYSNKRAKTASLELYDAANHRCYHAITGVPTHQNKWLLKKKKIASSLLSEPTPSQPSIWAKYMLPAKLQWTVSDLWALMTKQMTPHFTHFFQKVDHVYILNNLSFKDDTSSCVSLSFKELHSVSLFWSR